MTSWNRLHQQERQNFMEIQSETGVMLRRQRRANPSSQLEYNVFIEGHTRTRSISERVERIASLDRNLTNQGRPRYQILSNYIEDTVLHVHRRRASMINEQTSQLSDSSLPYYYVAILGRDEVKVLPPRRLLGFGVSSSFVAL